MNKLEQIRAINTECFLSDDPYSDITRLRRLDADPKAGFLTVTDCGVIVGYIIYYEYDNHIESLRRALTKEYRGQGLGIRLSKRLTSLARHKGKDIYTYVAKTNLASLNSNLKVGYRVDNIGEDWVYIRYKSA